eukprot:m51a1_g1497 hypothetical protein (523) ;mRNA; r:328832-330607
MADHPGSAALCRMTSPASHGTEDASASTSAPPPPFSPTHVALVLAATSSAPAASLAVETRVLAASASPYLRALVSGGWREQGAREVRILHECEPEAFERVLRFVHGARAAELVPPLPQRAGDADEAAGDDVWSLMSAASYFQLEELVRACEDAIRPTVDMENLTAVWSAAAELGCERLVRHCRAVFEEWDRAGNLRRAAPECGAGVALQVVFSIDTTGSMGSCIGQLKTKLSETVRTVLERVPQSSVAVVAHGDYCDETVIRKLDFTTDPEEITTFVCGLQPAGGGPTPEAYEWSLHTARGLPWRSDACKAVFLIGDSYPHAPSYTTEGTFWKDEVDRLAEMGVRVYGMAAAGVNPVALHFYKELARRSGALYIDFAEWQLVTDLCLATCFVDADRLQMEQFVDSLSLESEPDVLAEATPPYSSQHHQQQPVPAKSPPPAEGDHGTTEPAGAPPSPMRTDEPAAVVAPAHRRARLVRPVVTLEDPGDPNAPYTKEGWWDRAYDRGKPEYRLCPVRNIWLHCH